MIKREPDLDPRLLRTFVQIAEAGNFAQAARLLRTSQPAVSAQVRTLEDRLGASLFERTSGRRSVALTAAGAALLPHAYEMLRLNHAIVAAVAATSVAGTVRLAATEDHAAHLLPEIIGAFRREHPRVSVEIETGMTIEMRKRVGSTYDLVLAAQPVGNGGGEVLRREPLHWTGSPHHRAHLEDPLPLAVYPEGCVYRRWAEQALDRAGRAWRIAVTSASRSTLEATVLQGLAVSVLPGSSIKRPLVTLGRADGFPALPPLELALYRRRKSELSAHAALADAITRALGS